MARVHPLLKNERVRLSLSQEELAERVGTTPSNVSRWERGITSPTPYFRRKLCDPLIAKWVAISGVQVAAWGVKQMKTRWGTCTIGAARIWLNLELIKKPPHCLEYIVVHEMVHLLERHHNERFIAHMNRFMPLWRYYREELNREPLGHASWEY